MFRSIRPSGALPSHVPLLISYSVGVQPLVKDYTLTAFLISGLLGAMAYPQQSGNLLSVMAQPGASTLATRICVYIFSLGVIGEWE